MQEKQILLSDTVRIDLANECIWYKDEERRLTRKGFATLRYLIEHAGRLVSKEELLHTLWADVSVGDAVLTVAIGEIRRALEDDPKAPRFIATVHRRGYRFIREVVSRKEAEKQQTTQAEGFRLKASGPPPFSFSSLQPTAFSLSQSSAFSSQHSLLVGREEELEQLNRWFEKMLGGERQICFITGEAGIGKTAIIDTFLQHVAATHDLWIGRGHCVEQFGVGEAYLPVLEVLGQLARDSRQDQLVTALRHYAPTWLMHLPSLVNPAELAALQQRSSGGTQERMLREIAEAIESVARERPLILVFEDLHWSDYSTLDCIAVLARRRLPARLLILGTYRPVEVIVGDHPLHTLKQELQLHTECDELPLEPLPEDAIQQYLTRRFPGFELPATLAQVIYQRTEGNPLFVVNLVQDFVGQGMIEENNGHWRVSANAETTVASVPASVRRMVEHQLSKLPAADLRVFEAASLIGREFTVEALAAALDTEITTLDERCEAFARRRQFLHPTGVEESTEGTISSRYGFLHSLFQEVLHEQVGAGRRVRLHKSIGEWKEFRYQRHRSEMAAELAAHFDEGRDYGRAVYYFQLAAENAVRRYAHREALRYLTRALHLLPRLPDTAKRTQQELRLQATLGSILVTLKGTAAPEVEQAYLRAQELCHQSGETTPLFPILRGLFASTVMQGKLATGRQYAEQLLQLAQNGDDSALLLQAHYALGMTHYRQGAFVTAQDHLRKCRSLYDSQQHFSHAAVYGGTDPGVGAYSFMAWTLWHLGYPDQALSQSRAAMTLAQSLSHPYSQAFALNFAAWVHKLRREAVATQAQADAAIAIASEHGYSQMLMLGKILRGWALVTHGRTAEGLHDLQRGIEDWHATGTKDGRPYFLAMLAEAYSKEARVEDGLSLVNDAIAIVHETGECVHEAHLYQLKGILLLAQDRTVEGSKSKSQRAKVKGQKLGNTDPRSLTPDPRTEAEACFQHALQVARHQKAKALELRATMSLSRLWYHTGKQRQARQLLAKIYGWFTEGHTTVDLREAKDVLDQWS